MNLKFQSTTDHFDSKVGVSGMNSVHPAAGYSAAGKSRTQDQQEMNLKFQSTENADGQNLKDHFDCKVGVSGM